MRKIYRDAKGDAKTKIWLFSGNGRASHNIEVLSIFGRYIAGIILLLLSINNLLLLYLLFLAVLYCFWAFRKVNSEYREWSTSLWDPVLQVTSDMAVMSGFIKGIIS